MLHLKLIMSLIIEAKMCIRENSIMNKMLQCVLLWYTIIEMINFRVKPTRVYWNEGMMCPDVLKRNSIGR